MFDCKDFAVGIYLQRPGSWSLSMCVCVRVCGFSSDYNQNANEFANAIRNVLRETERERGREGVSSEANAAAVVGPDVLAGPWSDSVLGAMPFHCDVFAILTGFDYARSSSLSQSLSACVAGLCVRVWYWRCCSVMCVIHSARCSKLNDARLSCAQIFQKKKN